ncbi:anion permease [Candidatus Bathyarchaeota archaeon]|nr:anion permease [Candidatus Bathyarchaeota archaeon]
MIFETLLLALGFVICMILGANNASACFGANVGARFFRYSVIAGSAVLGVFLGVILEGAKLSRAIHHGVLAESNISVIWIIIVVALVVMVIATVFHVPLSLSESMIGSAVGAGLGFGAIINWRFTLTVFASWMINPFFAAFLAIAIYRLMMHLSSSVKNVMMLSNLYGRISLFLSFYVAYVLGANTVGLLNGMYAPLIGASQLTPLLFGSGTAIGIYFLSREITESVGRRIVGLSPTAAFVAQLSGALTVHLFTQFGLPVSITQALIGGIFGAGLSKKIRLINKRMIRRIIAGWCLAPAIGALISYTITLLI